MPFLERRITSFDNLSLYVRDFGDPLDRGHHFLPWRIDPELQGFWSLAERYSSDGRVICPDWPRPIAI